MNPEDITSIRHSISENLNNVNEAIGEPPWDRCLHPQEVTQTLAELMSAIGKLAGLSHKNGATRPWHLPGDKQP